MKIIFSNPPWWSPTEDPLHWRGGIRAGSRWPFTLATHSQPGRYCPGEYLPAPLFLSFAASYVQKAIPDAEVLFRDSIALRESYTRFYKWIEDERPDWLVVESATPSWEHDRKILESIRARLPACKVILYGPIASVYDPSWPVYACIRGEPEKGLVRVLAGGESGLIDFDLMTEAEMNAAPMPWMGAEYAYRYCDDMPIGQLFPHAQVWSSRGCPYKCSFCVWPAAMTSNDPDGTKPRSIRHYSANYMLAWLTDWKERFRFRCVYFDDDTMNLGQNHVKAMCGVMRQVGLPWAAMCRADGIDRDTWKEMKDSGCFGVKLGFESGSQYVIDKIINKRLNLDAAAETVHYLASIGMSVHGTFSLGHPGETKEQQEATLSYLQGLYRLGMNSHQLSGVAAIEGTPLVTLLKVGTLEKYPGASAEGFDRDTDGQRKIERMAAS